MSAHTSPTTTAVARAFDVPRHVAASMLTDLRHGVASYERDVLTRTVSLVNVQGVVTLIVKEA